MKSATSMAEKSSGQLSGLVKSHSKQSWMSRDGLARTHSFILTICSATEPGLATIELSIGTDSQC